MVSLFPLKITTVGLLQIELISTLSCSVIFFSLNNHIVFFFSTRILLVHKSIPFIFIINIVILPPHHHYQKMYIYKTSSYITKQRHFLE